LGNRAPESGRALTTAFADARARVLRHAAPLAVESVALDAALGRVLAAPAVACFDVPGFDNSAMDGFALRAADTAPGARLAIVGESRAGAPAACSLEAGEACAISTGAVMPTGADAVVRVESTRRDGAHVELSAAVAPGTYVRRAGEDIRAGASVLTAGTRLGPSEVGVLAALGTAQVAAHARPRVALLTTGDELARVGEPLPEGGVYDSASVALPALIAGAGAETISVAHARDDETAVQDAIARALEADVAVICGGMSVGAHDHAPAAMARLGIDVHFAGVALKPGRPTLFGTRGSTLVFGLPGNPVSSFVTFLLFVRPALRALAGEPPDRERRATAALTEPVAREPDRVQAVRCTLALRDDGWWATTTGPQASHILTSMLGAQAFALVPAGKGPLEAGARVEIELI
jgi:molybdopterin molybdotransferase